MGIHQRTELDPVLEAIRRGTYKQVYLCFGERYLCRQAAQAIEAALTADNRGTVHGIDGAAESATALLARLLSFSLLPGIQVFRVMDTNLFHSKEVGADIWDKAVKAYQNGKPEAAVRHLTGLLMLGCPGAGTTPIFSDISSGHWHKMFGFARPDENLAWADSLLQEVSVPAQKGSQDAADKLLSAMEQGFPANNVLLLTTEHVDKRKKLFQLIKTHGEIVDCSVAEGSSRAAVTQQKEVVREMARRTLAEFGKNMEPKALELLFERIGFHPVAVVMEVEKLALFVDERTRITVADLDELVGRTREDAIFELTEACSQKDAAKTLQILDHLLGDGIHGLAILGALRNFLRKLLVFRSLQLLPNPRWYRMNASEFQNRYLPELKERGTWPDMLKAHPYALFMSFSKAADYSIASLKRSLGLLLDAEFKLKSAPLPPRIVLEELLISLSVISRSDIETRGL